MVSFLSSPVATGLLSVVSAYGAGSLIYRLGPWANPWASLDRPRGARHPVTVVIPVRNEEKNIPHALTALTEASTEGPSAMQIIVVNDRSEDETVSVARGFSGVETIDAPPPAEGWVGKTWACAQGFERACHDYILFTDADVRVLPQAIASAVALAEISGAGLVSALPSHTCPRAWERALGAFHTAVLVALAPFRRPDHRSAYATGQFLLFTREAYLALGGHASVRNEIVEDVAFARLAAQNGIRVAIAAWPDIYQVRLYSTPTDFFAGWRRNFGQGFGSMRPTALIETTAWITALIPICRAQIPAFAVALAGLWIAGRRLGQFNWLSLALYPFALLAFGAVSAAAAFDTVLRRPTQWRGRSYDARRPRT